MANGEDNRFGALFKRHPKAEEATHFDLVAEEYSISPPLHSHPNPKKSKKKEMFKQLVLFLLLALATNTATGQCPTRPAGGSKSNSASQQAKECEVPNILDCSATTLSSSTASSSSSSSPSSSSPSSSSPSSSSPASDSTTSGMDSSSSSSSSASSSSSTSSPSSSAATVASSSSEPCPCPLMMALLNMKYMLLNSTQQVAFEQCLVPIRVKLVDGSLTVKGKVSRIASLLVACFKANPDIKKKLKNEKIDSWGRVYEFLLAGVSFDSVYVDGLVNPMDTDGNCNLTNSLSSATSGDVCGTGSSPRIQGFVGNLKKVTRKNTPGYDKGRKLGWLKKAFVKNFYPTLSASEQSCVMNVTIPAFNNASFGEFMDMCDQYEKASSIGTSVLNGTVAQNVLIQSLNQSLNSNSTVNSTSPATLQEANNFVQNLTIYFSSTTDIVMRLKFFAAQFAMLSSGCRDLLRPFPLLVTNFDCDVADLLATSHFNTDDQAGNITYGPPSCSYPETTMLDPVYNSSDLWDAVNSYYNASGNSLGFQSYRNSIKNCVYSLYPGNFTAKANCALYYLKGYNSSSITSNMRSMFLSTQIVTVLVETVTTVTYGTFASYITGCGCS